ncbi:aquaporin-10a isoform X1 [Stigmatopora argus]
MCRFLLLLWIFGTTPVFSNFQGKCLKREPPPGVLVLSPGSSLLLSCDANVKVNGTTVKGAQRSSNDRDGFSETQTDNFASLRTDEKKLWEEENGAQIAEFLTPTRTPPKGDDVDGGQRTRDVKGKFKWKWNGRTVGKGHRDWVGFELARRGKQLSVASVQLKDSGNYTCQQRGRKMFSLKVIVAETPEVPRLSCFKKSPSSKIRCHWTPRKPLTLRPNCYLFIQRRETFHRVECSFSSQWSRCWCVLDHNENELRTVHEAYLCVTNMAGNATSTLFFTPLGILKPDPPALSVRQDVGQENRILVSWTLPSTWKSQDNYYALNYELRYRPVDSSSSSMQLKSTKRRSFTIYDALPGVEYTIQIRTKEEFDGEWSDWSAAVYGSSWIDSRTKETIQFPNEKDLLNITFQEYDGSGIDSTPLQALTTLRVDPVTVSHHILWVSCTFAVFAVILAAFLFRHKEKLLAKLHTLGVRRHYKGSVQPKPRVPVAAEGRALVTFRPPCEKDEAPVDEKDEAPVDEKDEAPVDEKDEAPVDEKDEAPVDEEEDEVEENNAEMETSEAIHFNNTNYFFM